MFLKTNPFLYIFPKPNEEFLSIFEPFSKTYFLATSPVLFDVFQFAKDFKTLIDIKKFLKKSYSELSNIDIDDTIDELRSSNLLLSKSKLVTTTEKQRDIWQKKGWRDAFYYHLISRDYYFLDYSKAENVVKDRELMKSYAEADPVPDIYKTYPNAVQTELIATNNNVALFPPSFDLKNTLTSEHLAALLNLTFGEVRSMIFPVFGKSLLKTSPSGGARHPSEAYIITLSDLNIPLGVHHYSVKEKKLELIKEKKFDIDEIKKIFFMLNHHPNFEPEAIVVISSFFRRSMWRYRGEPRSFRVVFFDIGHLVATFRVLAQAMGLEVLVGQVFDDQRAHELLGLNNYNEKPLYFIAIGRVTIK